MTILLRLQMEWKKTGYSRYRNCEHCTVLHHHRCCGCCCWRCGCYSAGWCAAAVETPRPLHWSSVQNISVAHTARQVSVTLDYSARSRSTRRAGWCLHVNDDVRRWRLSSGTCLVAADGGRLADPDDFARSPRRSGSTPRRIADTSSSRFAIWSDWSKL